MFKSVTRSSIVFIVSAFSCFGQINDLESFQNRWHKYIETELEDAPEWSKSGWHFGNDINRPTIDSSLVELGTILWNKYNDQSAMNISDSCIPTNESNYNWLVVNESIKSDITAERAYENLKAKYNVTELQKAISDANIYMNGLKVVEFLAKVWKEGQETLSSINSSDEKSISKEKTFYIQSAEDSQFETISLKSEPLIIDEKYIKKHLIENNLFILKTDRPINIVHDINLKDVEINIDSQEIYCSSNILAKKLLFKAAKFENTQRISAVEDIDIDSTLFWNNRGCVQSLGNVRIKALGSFVNIAAKISTYQQVDFEYYTQEDIEPVKKYIPVELLRNNVGNAHVTVSGTDQFGRFASVKPVQKRTKIRIKKEEIDLATAGRICSGKELSIESRSIINDYAILSGQEKLSLQSEDSITNIGGKIFSFGDTEISSLGFFNGSNPHCIAPNGAIDTNSPTKAEIFFPQTMVEDSPNKFSYQGIKTEAIQKYEMLQQILFSEFASPGYIFNGQTNGSGNLLLNIAHLTSLGKIVTEGNCEIVGHPIVNPNSKNEYGTIIAKGDAILSFKNDCLSMLSVHAKNIKFDMIDDLLIRGEKKIEPVKVLSAINNTMKTDLHLLSEQLYGVVGVNPQHFGLPIKSYNVVPYNDLSCGYSLGKTQQGIMFANSVNAQITENLSKIILTPIYGWLK